MNFAMNFLDDTILIRTNRWNLTYKLTNCPRELPIHFTFIYTITLAITDPMNAAIRRTIADAITSEISDSILCTIPDTKFKQHLSYAWHNNWHNILRDGSHTVWHKTYTWHNILHYTWHNNLNNTLHNICHTEDTLYDVDIKLVCLT